MAAFREELAALPPLPGSGLFEDAAEVRAETLHVYLHMLTRRDPEQPTHNLHRTLEGLLANVTPPELLIVRRHLRTGWDAGGARRSRILDFLRKSSQMRLLRRCGVLTEASMESSFPDDFDIYLETIDLTEDADRGELRRLLGGIDDARIVRAVPGLIEQLGAEAARELLAFDARQTLAFAPVLLRARDPVALELIKKRLRQMRPDMAVARLMDLTTDPATITPEYLADLVDVLMGKPLSLQLCTYVAGCLQATVEELAATEGPESPGRIQAIRVIGKLGVPTGTAFLRDMMRRRKLVVFPAEPRRVREAIVDVLSGRPTAGWAA